jgi:hypothetical protein
VEHLSGPGFRRLDGERQELDVVHVLMAMECPTAQEISSDKLVDELSTSIPGAAVEVHHLHEGVASRYVESVVRKVGDNPREAFILMRCSREIQLAVSASRSPAVVYGQAYPGVNISYVEHDQAAVGRYLARYALDQGCRRFAILTHALWRFGDHKMIDAATATLAHAGVALNDVRIRSLAPHAETIAETVREFLQGQESPEGFLCRSDFYARIVQDVAMSLGKRADRMPCIVSGGQSPLGQSPLETAAPFARVVSTLTLAEEVDRLVKLLAESSAGADRQARVVTIPVRFCPPSRKGRRRSPHLK